MRDTSLQAYENIQPHIGRMQRVVLEAIFENRGVTRQGLTNIIGKPINCITGRVKELLQKGLITEKDKVNNQYKLYPTTLFREAV
ncbi:MAG: hypothetical protein LBL65_04645 [Campylobacteraceae bacterium]|jgi:predicted HTH transcriptional regulator|nr:hypothetical protein [Campylobacteraceae bacterium]